MSQREYPIVRHIACLLLLAGPVPLTAQQVEDTLLVRSSPVLVKYGKWAMALTAVGMGIKASNAHNDADRAFDRLQDYCADDPIRCDRGSNKRYLDPVAEGYYQTSLRRDRQARGWLVGGEAVLVGAAALFVWELTRPKRPPRNIPFEPTLTTTGSTTKVGLSLRF